jgi:hypothetical protein
MKVTIKREIYNHTVTMSQIGDYSLSGCMQYLQSFCGGFVWSEVETTEQELPKYAKYVDTYYGINVYFDSVTETFLFEDFN